MRTYEDLQRIDDTDAARMAFVLSAIFEHKSTDAYKEADVAYDYFRRRNKTILEYQKLLYTLSGEAVPDNYSANYKFCNSFFRVFVLQEVGYLLGNGVTFGEDSTKEALGGPKFDRVLMKAGTFALWGGGAFGFMNKDHVDVFSMREFVPLFGEEDGALHAGIRWWQIDDAKPLRATLYEEDGYTDYMWYKEEDSREGTVQKGQVLHPKRPYVETVVSTPADGEEIMDGQNYPGFPIVPLWGNEARQSELTGLREKIDGYDLIQSGFANDLDEASMFYWTINNAGGMDDIDLAKFIERMKVVHAAVVDDSGSHAEAHTMDVPYQARQTALAMIRDSLYQDAMALDTDKLSAGSITATAIRSSYANLDLKCDDFETQVTQFIESLLDLLGIEDEPTYKRNRIINVGEETQMILQSAQYLDQETILKHLPFLSPDELDEIQDRLKEAEAERFEHEQEQAQMQGGEVAQEATDEGAGEEISEQGAAMGEYGDIINSILNELTGESDEDAILNSAKEQYGNDVVKMLEDLLEEMGGDEE